MSLRKTYDLPRRPPTSLRFPVFMVAFVLAALILWLLLPDSAITVALLAVVLLAAVGAGVFRIFSAREVTRPPGHHPVDPRH